MGSEVSTIPRTRRVYYAAYASLPTSGLKTGDLAYATDRLVFYRWSGAAWQAITIHSSSGLAADIPTAANLPNGSLYFETDTSILKQVRAGAWATISPSPTFVSLSDTKVVRKTADETVNNSAILQNDDELLFAVGANEIWEFRMWVIITSPTLASLKTTFTIPAGGDLAIVRAGNIGVIAGATNAVGFIDGTTTQTYQMSAGDIQHLWWGRYIGAAAAGDVQFQWAQNAATAEDTKILANSFIIAHKLN